jgi:nucleotide-binding universal stress UspA family protein
VADERWGDRRLLEALILTSGRPTIVLPPRPPASRIRRVLVGWNGTREAARAVADAMPLLVKADAVEVLSVGSEAGEPAHGFMPGAAAARHLERHGAKVEVRHMSSNGESVGRVLLAEARAFHADLVVIGAYGRSRLRERVFGGVTRTVLREAVLPVLASH